LNQEPRKIRLWNGAPYRGGEGETQAGVPARGRKPSGASLPPLGGDAKSGPVSTGPIRRSFPSPFRDPPRLGRKGAYWQTSGLKKQAGSGAIDHIGAPAGTVFEGGDFALPRAVRGAPGAFPLPARPAARSLLSCTAGGGGRRFRLCARTRRHCRLGLKRHSEPVAAVEIGRDGGLAARRDGLAAGRAGGPFRPARSLSAAA
jgi:hypothetical protein